MSFPQITPSPEPKEEEDMEFIIVRDEFSDDEEPAPEPERKSVRSFRSFRSLESKDTEISVEDEVNNSRFTKYVNRLMLPASYHFHFQ